MIFWKHVFRGYKNKLLTRNGLVSLFPSYENQWIDLQCKSIDWFSCDGNSDTNPFRVKRRNVTNWTNLQRLRSFLRVWVARFSFSYMRFFPFPTWGFFLFLHEVWGIVSPPEVQRLNHLKLMFPSCRNQWINLHCKSIH